MRSKQRQELLRRMDRVADRVNLRRGLLHRPNPTG
jgi:hypothetical protein